MPDFEAYRKKPVEVKAFQWFEDYGECNGVELFTDSETGHDYFGIETLEGVMKIRDGDFVISGVKGELYPCKEDIFYQTYEYIDESDDEAENLLDDA